MHHKRGKRRNIRAGCKLCKTWKINGVNKYSKSYGRHSDRRQLVKDDDDRKEKAGAP